MVKVDPEELYKSYEKTGRFAKAAAEFGISAATARRILVEYACLAGKELRTKTHALIDKRAEKMLRDYIDGMSYADIAEKYKISVPKVSLTLKCYAAKTGVDLSPYDKRAVVTRDYAEVISRYASGERMASIAASLSVSRQRVDQIISKYGGDKVREAHFESLASLRQQEAEDLKRKASEEFSGHSCAVCGNPMLPRLEKAFVNSKGKKHLQFVTCSSACAKKWSVVRYHSSPEMRRRCKVNQARHVLKHSNRYDEYRVRWAQRVMDGTAKMSDTSRPVEGSKAHRILEQDAKIS